MEHLKINIVFQQILLSFIFLLFSSATFAYNWISDVDKMYKNTNPTAYEKTIKAKDLLDGNDKQVTEAVELLNEVITTYPNFAPAYVQLSRLISNINHSKKILGAMESSLQKALQLEPEYDYALVMMGVTKLWQRKLNEAEIYFEKAEQTGTKYPYLRSMRSELLRKQGRYKEAVEISIEGFNDYQNELEVAVNYINMIIYAYQKIKGTYDEQDYWHNKRIELRPDKAIFYTSYTEFLIFHKHDFDKAIVNAKKALEITDFKRARRLLATALYCKWSELDDTPNMQYEALEYFKKAASVDTDLNYLIKQMRNNMWKHNQKTMTPIVVKLSNYYFKRRNSQQDFETGKLEKYKYDLLISTP